MLRRKSGSAGRTKHALIVGAVVSAALAVTGALTLSPGPEESPRPAAGAALPAVDETTRVAAAAPALTLKTMTFNVCANTKPDNASDPNARCINGQRTSKVAGDLANRLRKLHPDTRVAFLQEICYADVEAVRGLVGSGWKFRFTGIKDEGTGSRPSGTVTPRACAKDRSTGKSRGNFGVAIGVKAAAATFKVHYFPEAHVPHARDKWGHWNVHQAAICADVSAFAARVCGTHLTPVPGGSSSEFVNARAGQVQDLIGYGGNKPRVILGGDLNAVPPAVDAASPMGKLYAGHTECDQANYGGARNGEATFQNADGSRWAKIDYIFTNKNTTTSCYVTNAHVKSSDHIPVYATIKFPAM
jgi:endonuclease/exonuclease/phosphatase family metal-dependent hydrolase